MAIAERCRTLVRAGAVCAALTLAVPALARAQGPVYVAQPPTPGALYRDGQSDRYLLGGEWLSRADLADARQSAGWWRNVASTDGWSPVTMPNSYNANDLSSLSMSGYVGWYRRDFTLPTTGAFSRLCPDAGTATGSFASTRSTTARPCGSTAGGSAPMRARTCRSSSISRG